LSEFADERIDLAQCGLSLPFQITADESVLVDFQFQCSSAGVIGCRRAVFPRQGEHTQDPSNPGCALMAMDGVTECADVRSSAGGARQQLRRT
jgi:hypothetical protein